MKVSIVQAPREPFILAGTAAGICYGKDAAKEEPAKTKRRAERCYEMKHDSVWEHVAVTFRIEGISRACSHQLVRHRLASYCQESQRYCRYDKIEEVDVDDWMVIPPDVKASKNSAVLRAFKAHAIQGLLAYKEMLRDGVKPEDARFLLPEGTKTNLIATMNLRQFFHFLDMRADSHAQWEIRELAREMTTALREYDEDYGDAVDMYLKGRNNG